MKLVQMPPELLHLEYSDLPALGVDERLLAEFEAYLSGATDDHIGLAILALPDSGTRELLMVLARQVGAALRNENIRLRDHPGNPRAGYKKLCYLPGSLVSQAVGMPRARRSLEDDAACFFQDLDLAWADAAAAFDPKEFLDLLDLRLTRRLPTYVSANPDVLPFGLARELRARLRVLEATG